MFSGKIRGRGRVALNRKGQGIPKTQRKSGSIQNRKRKDVLERKMARAKHGGTLRDHLQNKWTF